MIKTLNHEAPDRVCVDLGGTFVSSISVRALAALREAVLGDSDYRVKVTEPYQMVGEVDEELADALGIDVVDIIPRTTMFGFENKDFKPFTLCDGTEVEVPGDFNVTQNDNGDWLMYPEGDLNAEPSAIMPKSGFYFDALCRQDPIDDDHLDPADNLEEFGPLSDADMAH